MTLASLAAAQSRPPDDVAGRRFEAGYLGSC